MRLVPHVHKFERIEKVVRWYSMNGLDKETRWPAYECPCGKVAATEVEVMHLEHESIIWRASVLCMWAISLGMLIVGLIMLYRWSFDL